jgi:hypothetical protein
MPKPYEAIISKENYKSITVINIDTKVLKKT